MKNSERKLHAYIIILPYWDILDTGRYPAKDAQAACAEFTETFQALHPETEPGNRLLDLFPERIVRHLSPRMSDDRYGDYVKQLDAVLAAARQDMDCVHISSDASAPTKGALQASLATLVFRGGNKIAHIVAAGGRATAPNAELMALEMGVSTALAAGCSSLVCFTDSTLAMSDLVDPSPHSGQVSSLAACSALRTWLTHDPRRTVHLWHVPSKEEWKIHHDAHEAAKAAQIPLRPGCRVSFDFARASKEVEYRWEWHREFSDPAKRGRGFLELVGREWEASQTNVLKGGGVESFFGVWQQRVDCQGVQSHCWPCSYWGVSPAISSWGTDLVLVSPLASPDERPYITGLPTGDPA